MSENNHIGREFIKYTGLNVLGMIGLSCYILADTFFVSKAMGTNGLAALNLAISVYSLISATGLMLGIGGATRFSIFHIQGNQKEGRRGFTRTVLLGLMSRIFCGRCFGSASDRRDTGSQRGYIGGHGRLSQGHTLFCTLFYHEQHSAGVCAQ